MNTDIAQDRIKAALKQLLKRQNSTYADVAKVWGCSVPTVKRLLGPEELSLSRLLSLLDWLNLNLSELQKLAESENLDNPVFTTKQNEFLAKNPAAFAVLMKLFEEETPQALMRKYSVPQAVMDRYLIQLEKHDLIRVGSGGKVKPAFARMPRLEGPLGDAHFRNILDRFNAYFKATIGRSLSDRKNSHGSFSWIMVEMREETYKHYASLMKRLMDEIEAASKIELRQYKKSELKAGVFSIGTQLEDPDSPQLRMVADMFGEMLSGHQPAPTLK